MDNSWNISQTLGWYQDNIRRRLTPALVYLALIGLVGIPGNICAVLIFKKYKKNVYRSILMAIGSVDLLFCVIGIPFNTARIVFYYDFDITWICQLFAGILDLGIIFSANLIMLLAIHRFRQLFMQLKPQITTDNINTWIGISFAISLLLFIPHLTEFQPLETISLAINLTGSVCAVSWKDAPLYWRVYNIFLTTLFLLYTLTMLMIYVLIGRKIVRSNLKRRSSAMNYAREVTSTRMTKISFAVCIVFAFSYLPLFLDELLAEEINQSKMNDVQFSSFKIYERSYLINHIINPLIFTVMDTRFRRRLLELLKCRRKKSQVNSVYERNSINFVKVYTVSGKV